MLMPFVGIQSIFIYLFSMILFYLFLIFIHFIVDFVTMLRKLQFVL